MTVRLTIAPGDHYDFEIKPFEAMTVADNIRINAPMPEGLAPLQEEQEVLQRYSNAPTRYIRCMKMHEVQAVLKHINEVTKAMQASDDALSKVKETLAKWEEEHEGKEWTREDAQEVLKSHGLFRDTITVEGKTFTAPLVEEGDYGQLLDLERQMHASKSEAESYVRALSIMMEGDDGKYPVQRDGESDTAYANRCDARSQERQRLFMAAPWIEVMGIAAFFFSRSQHFAAICGHNMKLLNSWLSPKTKREPIVIPSVGDLMQS